MPHPSYLLNPGDMFQVDIDRVMTATGKPKRPDQKQKSTTKNAATEAVEGEEAEADAEATETAGAAEGEAEPVDPEAAKAKHMAILKELKSRTKMALSHQNHQIRAKTKKSLRKYLKEVEATLNKSRKADRSASEMSAAEAELTALFDEISLAGAQREAASKESSQPKPKAKPTGTGTTSTPGLFTEKQRKFLGWMMEDEHNPYDSSKPYATPWRPREWMAPWAFIPRYLEVNQRICAAVYLRHPVARPGLSEVPTPFPIPISQLAFIWYQQRG